MREVKYWLDQDTVRWIHVEDSNIMIEAGSGQDSLVILIDASLFADLRKTMDQADSY